MHSSWVSICFPCWSPLHLTALLSLGAGAVEHARLRAMVGLRELGIALLDERRAGEKAVLQAANPLTLAQVVGADLQLLGELCATVRGGVCGSLLPGPAKPSRGTLSKIYSMLRSNFEVCALHPSSYPRCPNIASIMSLGLSSQVLL